jgi:hypothetical protein
MIGDIRACKASGNFSDRFVIGSDGRVFGNDWNEDYNQERLS